MTTRLPTLSCLDCKSFRFSMGSDGFDEIDAVCECRRGVWAMAKNDFKDESELRKHATRASTCAEFAALEGSEAARAEHRERMADNLEPGVRWAIAALRDVVAVSWALGSDGPEQLEPAARYLGELLERLRE